MNKPQNENSNTASGNSEITKKTLEELDVHDSWASGYRTPDNDAFFDMAFDYIKTVLNPEANEKILDAGCGAGTKTLRLAKRGFVVVASDFSESILEIGKTNIEQEGLSERVSFRQEDILQLSFNDETFPYILSWGVLMHIPDIEKAISELSRVTQPGGIVVISEGNASSLQARGLRLLKRLLGRERAIIKKTPAGLEFWEKTNTGDLMTRQANIPWVISEFEKHGLMLKVRSTGQFTELYTKIRSPILKKVIHIFNNFWFRYIRMASPSFANILFLEKSK